jgi:hypothetical protein
MFKCVSGSRRTVSATAIYWTEVMEEYGAFSRMMTLAPK